MNLGLGAAASLEFPPLFLSTCPCASRFSSEAWGPGMCKFWCHYSLCFGLLSL